MKDTQTPLLILALLAAPLLTALAPSESITGPPATPSSLVEHGRQVYIAEGCIHCHSQYARPTDPEVRWFSAASSAQSYRNQEPVLIGNRRQGPDLATIGARRTAEWHRLHLMRPDLVSPGSRMPSYAYLFATEDHLRGEALVAYLDSLGRNPPID